MAGELRSVLKIEKGIFMDIYSSIFIMLSPWLIFILLALVAKFLIKSAKRRCRTAVAFAAFSQMLLPDPQIEKTIEMIVEIKRSVKVTEEDEENKKNEKKPK